MRKMFLLLAAWLLAGCQTTNGIGTATGPTPAQLSASADQGVKGARFSWAGSIISIRNLKDRTLLEVMAYPAGAGGRPRPDRRPQGRFIADHAGFLEPAEYPPGRLVTVTGPMLGYMDGTVGEAPYRYPVLRADELQLWEREAPSTDWSRPAINVGIGIGGGSGGGWGNIGIGIGF